MAASHGMKIAIVGAGAIGGYFSAVLSRAGFDVTLVARGENLEAIAANGVRVKSVAGEFVARPKVVGDPSAAGHADLLIMAVKSYDTAAAIGQCAPIVKKGTIVMAFQNGLDNEEKIGSVVGRENVLPCLVRGGTFVESPGVISVSWVGRIEIGELDGKESARTEAVGKIFEKCGVPCAVETDIRKAQWRKFLWNVAFNQVCAVTKCTCGQAVALPEGRALLKLAALEAVEVGRKTGVSLEESDVESIFILPPGFDTFKPSMLQDIESGKRAEMDTFGGAVVRLGKELSVPTPVNDCLYSLLKLLKS